MTDDRCLLNGKNFAWGMTKFTQPMDRAVSVATVYCIDKSSGIYFNDQIEILDDETRDMSFKEALDRLQVEVTGALKRLQKTVIDYYAVHGETK